MKIICEFCKNLRNKISIFKKNVVCEQNKEDLESSQDNGVAEVSNFVNSSYKRCYFDAEISINQLSNEVDPALSDVAKN